MWHTFGLINRKIGMPHLLFNYACKLNALTKFIKISTYSLSAKTKLSDIKKAAPMGRPFPTQNYEKAITFIFRQF